MVDVTGLNGLAWFDRAGDFASSKLHVVERFTRSTSVSHQLRGYDRRSIGLLEAVENQSAAVQADGKNAQILEFKCVEFAEELLYGEFKKQTCQSEEHANEKDTVGCEHLRGTAAAASAPVWAHHAFQAEFDQQQAGQAGGKVTEMEWINPHAWIHIDVKNPDGTVTNWMVECGSPNIMLRRGFTKRSLEVGSDIVVQGYQAKNGAYARQRQQRDVLGRQEAVRRRVEPGRSQRAGSSRRAFHEQISCSCVEWPIPLGRADCETRGGEISQRIHSAENCVGRSRPAGTMAGDGQHPHAASGEPGRASTLTPEELKQRQSQAGAKQPKATARSSRRHETAVSINPPGYWVERGKPHAQASLVVDPPNGRIPPLTPEGQAYAKSLRNGLGPGSHFPEKVDTYEDFDFYSRCITRGLVSSMLPTLYNFGNEIVQAPGVVVIRNEMIHETRVIPLDGRPHVGKALKTYIGDSRGHWEGDTWWWRRRT